MATPPFQTPPGRRTVERYLQPGSSGRDASQFYGRGDLLPIPRDPRNITGHLPSSELNMLQTISMTLSDIQVQLSSIQEHNLERDATLKQLEHDLKEIKATKRSANDAELQEPKKSKKSPRGLSACVRKVHASFTDENQYHANEGIKSSHNQDVTGKIIKNIIDSGDYSQKDDISYAAKKYHEYLVRQQKLVDDDEKQCIAKKNRIVQRRQRLFERRKKCAIRREVPIMQVLSEKFMSDEETDAEDGNSLVKRTLKWRSEKLNELICKLDERYSKSREKNDNVRPMKARKTGSPSGRPPPGHAPHWALADPCNLPESTETDDTTVADQEQPLSDIGSPTNPALENDYDEDPEMSDWISRVTGVQV